MASERLIQRYRNGYAKLLRLYPKPYRERFGEGMEQTFNDLCRERLKAEKGLFSFALWTFLETSLAIIRENTTMLVRCAMDRGSTIFLRVVIALIAIAGLAVCIFALPGTFAREAAKTPDTAYQIYLFLAGAYVMAALFFFALYQAFRLLTYIDRNEAFSELSVKALRHIKRPALAVGLLTVTGIAAVMVLTAGTGEDIAGVVMMGLMMTFASSVFAAIAAVLQKQVQKAIEVKNERP